MFTKISTIIVFLNPILLIVVGALVYNNQTILNQKTIDRYHAVDAVRDFSYRDEKIKELNEKIKKINEQVSVNVILIKEHRESIKKLESRK